MFIILQYLPEQNFNSENGGSIGLGNVGIKLMYYTVKTLETSGIPCDSSSSNFCTEAVTVT
jgi:hypothetical protein